MRAFFFAKIIEEASGSQKPESPGLPGFKKDAERISGSLGETVGGREILKECYYFTNFDSRNLSISFF